MTDDGVLAVREGLGIDRCPECGGTKFTLKRSTEMEKEINLESDSATSWDVTHMDVVIETMVVECNKCGESWRTDY